MGVMSPGRPFILGKPSRGDTKTMTLYSLSFILVSSIIAMPIRHSDLRKSIAVGCAALNALATRFGFWCACNPYGRKSSLEASGKCVIRQVAFGRGIPSTHLPKTNPEVAEFPYTESSVNAGGDIAWS